LHRSDYLFVPDPVMEPPDRETVRQIHLPKALAVRGLIGGGCLQQRVSDLLGVSRRTIGRLADADCSIALHDPQLLEGARTCLEDTVRRGSTVEEREAAAAWLREAARDEHQVEVKSLGNGHQPERTVPKAVAVKPLVSISRNRKARVHAHRPTRNGAPRNGSGNPQKVPPGNLTARAVIPDPPAPAPLIHVDDVDALRRQQQRILHRSALITYVLAAETRTGAPLTLGDTLAELLEDIAEAARTIGTLLPTTNARP
jgi:hypothetical protein